MADNDLVLRIPHSLGATEAHRRVAEGVASAQARYGAILQGVESHWEGNVMNFRVSALAQTVEGDIDVRDDFVELRAKLPLVIRLLAKRFLPTVQNTGQKLLT